MGFSISSLGIGIIAFSVELPYEGDDYLQSCRETAERESRLLEELSEYKP